MSVECFSSDSGKMTSARCFREFVNERLSAAAEEIFRVFEQTVSEYQEEISRQRRLLDSVAQPEIKLQHKGLMHHSVLENAAFSINVISHDGLTVFVPEMQFTSFITDGFCMLTTLFVMYFLFLDILQFSVHDEEAPVDEQNLCDQDGMSALDLNNLEVTQIKEEEELWTSLKEEQNILSQETYLSKLNPTGEGRNHSEGLPLLLENHGSDEDVSQSNVSVVVIKSESDQEDLVSPLQNSHRDLNQEGLSPDHTTDKKLLKCSFCPKKVSDFMKLKIHIRTHTGEKQFQCDTCGKSFSKMPLLKKHMITHSGLKPFICGVCGKKFNFSSNRDTHMKTHSTEKPHTCDICGKAFRRSADLKRHSRSHTGEKPYSCSFCGQVFPYHTSLKNHLRRHTGENMEKPHTCDICGKAFSRSADLKRHSRSHTGEKPYSCSFCGTMVNCISFFLMDHLPPSHPILCLLFPFSF
uniref:C2H2-type domain-containing protein n=1 Tax=Salarias fasciatus TaxID=181472 RepID=A0A672I938_SALFA